MSAAPRTARLLRWGVLAVVVAAPLPRGGVGSTSVLALELAAAALGVLTLCLLALEPERFARPVRLALAATLAVLGLGVLQLLPLPAVWVAWLAPQVAHWRVAVATVVPEAARATYPLSLSPAATLDAVLRLAAWVTIGLAAAVAWRGERRSRRSAALVIAGLGAVHAFYGISEYVSGHDHLLVWPKRYYLDRATGTFVNPNHFASFLAMSLPFAAALALGSERKARSRDALHPARVAGALAAATIVLGVLLSYSRGGLAAALVAIVALSAALAPLGRGVWRSALALLLLPAALLCWQDLAAPGGRLVELGNDAASSGGRAAAWRSAASMVADQPWLGFGYGTFEQALPPYREAAVRVRFDHAHNEWLEAATEGGWLVLPPLLALLWIALSSSFRATSAGADAVAAAAGATVVAAAFHALIDFSLRIPANAILLAFALGLTLASLEVPLVLARPRSPGLAEEAA